MGHDSVSSFIVDASDIEIVYPSGHALDVTIAAPAFSAEDALAEVMALEAAEEAQAAQERVTQASKGNGRWGASTFHNLTEGARASGMVGSAHALLAKADLAWDPEFRPLTASGISVNESIGRAVVRSDNGQTIGIVGAQYQIIPHSRLADFADALCGADTGLHYGNAGHKKNGALPFLQLKTSGRVIGRDIRGQSVETRDVITLLTSHDGSLKTLATYGANIVVCDNTYAHALDSAKAHGIAIRHTASGTRILEEAIRIASACRTYASAFDNAALRLMTTVFDDSAMRALASSLIPGESMRSANARAELITAWTSSPGAAPGSAWGAAQAVTHYTSHTMAVRGETDRAFGLATGDGTGSEVQAKAWWHLTTDEGAAALRTVSVYS